MLDNETRNYTKSTIEITKICHFKALKNITVFYVTIHFFTYFCSNALSCTEQHSDKLTLQV